MGGEHCIVHHLLLLLLLSLLVVVVAVYFTLFNLLNFLSLSQKVLPFLHLVLIPIPSGRGESTVALRGTQLMAGVEAQVQC